MKTIRKLSIAAALTVTLAVAGTAAAQDKSILVQSTTSTANSAARGEPGEGETASKIRR